MDPFQAQHHINKEKVKPKDTCVSIYMTALYNSYMALWCQGEI